jgi:hypothetical protein
MNAVGYRSADALDLLRRIDNERVDLAPDELAIITDLLERNNGGYEFIIFHLLSLVRKAQVLEGFSPTEIGLVFNLVGNALRREKAPNEGMG